MNQLFFYKFDKPMVEFQGFVKGLKKPCLVISKVKWNDFGYETLFDLDFIDGKGEVRGIGKVKIANSFDNYEISLDDSFQELPEQYFSLGTSLTFYKNLIKEFGVKRGKAILEALHDCAISDLYHGTAREHPIFETSLKRSSTAVEALEKAKELFATDENEKIVSHDETSLSFEYTPEGYPKLFFNFSFSPILPYRWKTIIGKNGSGKTTIIKSLAADLAGINDIKEGTFLNKPTFSKILLVSLSPFDSFYIPTLDFKTHQEASTQGYEYIGLRYNDNKEGERLLNSNDLFMRSRDMLRDISSDQIKRDRFESWINILLDDLDFDVRSDSINLEYYFQRMSSGAKYLFFSVLSIAHKVFDNSFFLFDEPENYLHPTLIQRYIRLINAVLEDTRSYGVIATHSPVVVRDTPSKNVFILGHDGIRQMRRESFGDELGAINSEVFGMDLRDSVFDLFINKIIEENKTKEKLETLFGNNININIYSRIAL